jgi:hypothetical protein
MKKFIELFYVDIGVWLQVAEISSLHRGHKVCVSWSLAWFLVLQIKSGVLLLALFVWSKQIDFLSKTGAMYVWPQFADFFLSWTLV